MRKLFRRLPLPFKLVFMPLLFLIYLTVTVFIEKKQKLSLLEGYIQRIGLSANLSRLIDNLQYERQYSFDYVLKKGERQKMLDHRQRADSLIHLLETSKDSALRNFPSYSLLHNIRQTRNGSGAGWQRSNGCGSWRLTSTLIQRLSGSSPFRKSSTTSTDADNDQRPASDGSTADSRARNR